MPPLPDRTTATLKAIHAAREAENPPFGGGYGISISEAGNECPRAIWYAFRWASPPEQHSARMLRLFATGHMEEERLLNDLEKVEGVTLLRHDPETGKQWRVSIAGFINGKMDAVALGLPEAPKTWHVVECKSANDKTFSSIIKKGVEKGNPSHWIQMQLYMLETGMERALYMLVNKNTDEEYIERVPFNKEEALRAQARLQSIADTRRAPAKIHEDATAATNFLCRFCRHKAACHEGAFAVRSCRTCLHSSPVNGAWHCARWDHDLSIEEQKEGCDAHRYVPDLVPGTQEDVRDEAVVYRMADGSEWVDGEGS